MKNGIIDFSCTKMMLEVAAIGMACSVAPETSTSAKSN